MCIGEQHRIASWFNQDSFYIFKQHTRTSRFLPSSTPKNYACAVKIFFGQSGKGKRVMKERKKTESIPHTHPARFYGIEVTLDTGLAGARHNN